MLERNYGRWPIITPHHQLSTGMSIVINYSGMDIYFTSELYVDFRILSMIIRSLLRFGLLYPREKRTVEPPQILVVRTTNQIIDRVRKMSPENFLVGQE